GRRHVLDCLDQLMAVEPGHDQVAEHQVDAALLELLQCILSGAAGDHAVAARFQDHLADGEGLLVIVNAQNRSFRFHGRGCCEGRNCLRNLSLQIAVMRTAKRILGLPQCLSQVPEVTTGGENLWKRRKSLESGMRVLENGRRENPGARKSKNISDFRVPILLEKISERTVDG